MTIYQQPDAETLKNILKRPLFEVESLHQTVGNILQDVKERGDAALKEYTQRFDKIDLEDEEQMI